MAVYIVQNTLRKTEEGELVPKFDFSAAGIYGELVELLSPSARPQTNAKEIIVEMKNKLAFFNDDDFILCVGSPVLIAWAGAIAARINQGRIKLLQWSGTEQAYNVISVDLEKDLPFDAENSMMSEQ